jgi:hypothetical protein
MKKFKFQFILLILSFLVYLKLIFYSGGNCDMVWHTFYLVNHGYPPNFIYYLLIDLLSFFTKNTFLLNVAALFVLVLALLFKFELTKKIGNQLIIIGKERIGNEIYRLDKTTFYIMLVFSLPSIQLLYSNHYYLGQLPPNIWHNSTTMLLMPISCLIFLKTCNAITIPESLDNIKTASIILLLSISIFIKPSFAFLYFPAITFIGVKKKSLKLLMISFSSVALILLQYYLIYLQNGYLDQEVESTIKIDFLYVWKNWLDGKPYLIFFSIISSLLFPIIYIVFFFKNLKNDDIFQLSIIMAIVGIVMFMVLKEDGPRVLHGNFIWNSVVGLYFLWVYLVYDFQTRRKIISSFLVRFFDFLFKLHVLSGIIYILFIFFNGKYF